MNLINPVVRESVYEFFSESPNEVQSIQFSQIEPTVTITYETKPANPEYYRRYEPPFEETAGLQQVAGPNQREDGVYEALFRIDDTEASD